MCRLQDCVTLAWCNTGTWVLHQQSCSTCMPGPAQVFHVCLQTHTGLYALAVTCTKLSCLLYFWILHMAKCTIVWLVYSKRQYGLFDASQCFASSTVANMSGTMLLEKLAVYNHRSWRNGLLSNSCLSLKCACIIDHSRSLQDWQVGPPTPMSCVRSEIFADCTETNNSSMLIALYNNNNNTITF